MKPAKDKPQPLLVAGINPVREAVRSGVAKSAHDCSEGGVAVTLAECWQLVDTSEKTRRHCVILENCCYGYDELLALNMVRAGVLGTLTHAEAAYIHDLRATLLGDRGEGLWRRKPHITSNRNLYPTHGLGPVAFYLGINHGDRFATLVSMSSRAAALAEGEWRFRTVGQELGDDVANGLRHMAYRAPWRL